jgi:hypothetical protein
MKNLQYFGRRSIPLLDMVKPVDQAEHRRFSALHGHNARFAD